MQGWEHEIITDIRSGINAPECVVSAKLVRLLITGFVKRLVITHKNQGIFTFDASQGKMPRLLRFGAELIFSLCEQLNVEVVIINHDVNASPEQELVQDVLEMITVFSAQSLPDRIFALARALRGYTGCAAIRISH